MKKFLSILASLSLMLTLGVANVQATTTTLDELQLDELTGANGITLGAKTPAATLIAVINALFGLLGTIALLIFLYAGFQWMMSGDSADGAKKAKERMKNAAIGIFLVLAAYSISSFVIGAITDVTK